MNRPSFFAAILFATALRAQTYTPKAIRIEGVSEADRPEVLKRLALPEHAPLTKQQIEEAMGRLAETGNYTDLRYTVDAQALVVTLKTAAGTTQSLPVNFENLVWWQPEELERLLEARVPLFHGQIPLTGSMTDDVRAALLALLAEKGVAGAHIEVSMQAGAFAMAVDEPHVLVGAVTLPGTAPEAAGQMEKVIARLQGRDFLYSETLQTVRRNALDTHFNAGYLDASVDMPSISAPRREGRDYVVDVSATAHPQSLYRVGSVEAAPFVGDAGTMKPGDLLKAAGIKAGDPAGAMTLAIGVGLAERAVRGHGFLDAKVTAQVTRDTAAHTVAYRFACTPGSIYTVDHVDATAMPAPIAARFLEEIGVHKGDRADADTMGSIMRGLAIEHLAAGASITIQPSAATHTAVYVIKPQGSGGGR